MNNLQAFYDQKVKLYKPSKVRESKILELMRSNIKGKKVLDIGCADGTFGAKLTKRGAIVYGVDISPVAVKIAKEKFEQARVVDLNNEKLPFAAETFDFVIASEITEHLFNPANLLMEAKRVLKDEGVIILTTPNFLYWGNRIKFLFGNFKYETSGIFDDAHVHFYTYKSLRSEVKEAGLNILRENHVYAGSEILKSIKSRFPSLFAYQFVILSQKK